MDGRIEDGLTEREKVNNGGRRRALTERQNVRQSARGNKRPEAL